MAINDLRQSFHLNTTMYIAAHLWRLVICHVFVWVSMCYNTTYVNNSSNMNRIWRVDSQTPTAIPVYITLMSSLLLGTSPRMVVLINEILCSDTVCSTVKYTNTNKPRRHSELWLGSSSLVLVEDHAYDNSCLCHDKPPLCYQCLGKLSVVHT